MSCDECVRTLRAIAVAAALSLGCTPTVEPRPAITPEAFLRASEKLAALDALLTHERTATIRLALRAPYLPSEVSSRGAVATRPPEDLRMMLLGPGGATAMDVWLHGDRFRMEIPAIDRVVRGDASTPSGDRRGLPIGFFRWWLLRPFTGKLHAARDTPRGLEVLLRQDEAWIDMVFLANGSIEATRRSRVDVERLTTSRIGCGRTTYVQESTKLEAIVECESERDGANAKAFEEPCDGEDC